ncbi:RNA polymerase sigma-70 factor [Maribacter sp.]|uniref:RNA polymerase sigma factor n=1 Tax=Maribacter sp. TaxID=1897614 RepID=UPI0025BF3A19|nr:RNA polymerase sigma-70 factor [Maribacter sp.]
MSINFKKKDQILLSEMKMGSERAFQKLFDKYWEPLFFKANFILQNEEVAKDIVQNIWIDFWEKREERVILNLEAYLFKTVTNNCLKYFRDYRFSLSHIRIIEALEIPDISSIEKQYDLEETENTLKKSLKALSPKCRRIFALSKLEELSNEEIAFKLGISQRTVENQLSLALKNMRKDFVFFK